MSGEGRDPWEPLTKSLVAAALVSLFGVPPAVTTGGWDTMRGLFGGATSKPVPDELLRAVQKWRKTEGLGDDLIEPILANTTDILRKYGLSHQEVLQFKAMPAVCAAEVNKRAASLLVSLGEREAASVRRLVEELYADLTRLDGTRSAIEEAYKKYILHLVVENQKRAQDTIEQHSREQTDRREQQLDRARKSVQGKLFPRSDENPARVPFQESGLYHEAVEALRYDWAEDVADRCQALADRVAAEPGRDCAKLSQDLRRIDTHRPFLEILRKIRDLDLSLNLDWVRRSNGQSAAAGVLPTLRWLRSQRLTPSFRWILPVTGDWGSGKTRLFQQLADDALDQGRQLMFLRPGHSHGAEKMLLDQVRQDWSLDMSSFEDLHDWILKANTSALIVVDDVETIIRDDPHWVEDFRHLIEKSTHLKKIRWAVGADFARYDLLGLSQHADFWKKYGVPGTRQHATDVRSRRHRATAQATTLGGWIDCQESNQRNRLGHAIVETARPGAGRDAIRQLGPSYASFLCNPLPAWLGLENLKAWGGRSNQGPEQVVDAFWERLKSDLADPEVREETLHQVTGVLADLFATDAHISSWPQATCRAQVQPTLDQIAPDLSASAVLRLLRRGQLLRFDNERGHIQPGLDIFWARRITVRRRERDDWAVDPVAENHFLISWQTRADRANGWQKQWYLWRCRCS